MTTLQIPQEQRFVLDWVPWPTYVAYAEMMGERHVRVTYHQGRMEFMTLSPEHEHWKHRLVLLVAVVAEEMNIDIAGYGSMTWQREDLERGMEPDECYWIANEARVRGRTEIDLANDPPPDLALEVEISRSALPRMKMFASFGVPEIWRFDGQTLRFCVLGPNGEYTEQEKSRAFPFLSAAELARFLTEHATESETKLMRTFRIWVREQIARGWTSTPSAPLG
jgi:Uma2 family endonuclease